MYRLKEGFFLPETEVEFSYLELEGGIGDFLERFCKSIETEPDEIRKHYAERFCKWLVKHSEVMHRIGLMKVVYEVELDQTKKFNIVFGDNITATIEIKLPVEGNPVRLQPLILELMNLVSNCEIEEIV
jgi:hypothetical protein